jgi:hypothetical protein
MVGSISPEIKMVSSTPSKFVNKNEINKSVISQQSNKEISGNNIIIL